MKTRACAPQSGPRHQKSDGLRAIAPRDGLIPAIVGLKRPIDLSIEGDGSWTRWRGAARLLVERREAANLALAADSGRYRLKGGLALAPFLKAKCSG